MKTIAIVVGLVLVPFTLCSQDLTGQWRGTIAIQGIRLEIIFHVSRKDGRFVSTLDSPDQNAYRIPVSTTTFNHPDVKFDMSSIGAVFSGKLSDGQITGTWSQSGQSLSLSLTRNY
jgi:hypothetical protein